MAGRGATYAWIGIWLAASAAGAALCVTLLARAIGRGSGVGRVEEKIRPGFAALLRGEEVDNESGNAIEDESKDR
jgi:hypothetical protein